MLPHHQRAHQKLFGNTVTAVRASTEMRWIFRDGVIFLVNCSSYCSISFTNNTIQLILRNLNAIVLGVVLVGQTIIVP